MSELEELEKALKANLDSYVRRSEQTLPRKSKPRPPLATGESKAPAVKRKRSAGQWKPKERAVHRIILRVQRKKIAAHELFPFESPRLSRIDAENDARKAAKEAGFPVICFVEDWITL